MRIAVNTRLLVPDKMDGIGRFTYETLIRITENHPEHHFDFIFDREPPKGFQFPENVSFKKLGLPARHPVLWYLWFEHSLKNYINKNNYDFFLSPEGWVPPSLNCKSLAVIHDLNFEHYPENIIYSHRVFLKYFFPKYASRSTRIVTVSEFSKNDISNTYGISPNNIDVVYNGANGVFQDVSETKKGEIKKSYSKGEDYFLFIGTIHPRKNLEHLLLAFEYFKQQGSKTKLLIVGNKKWWPQKLDKILQSSNYQESIIFLGRKSDKELAQILATSIALTYVPYFEGFGIPILEAFLAQTPVITSNLTSMPEVSNGAAILCNPRNPEEIAQSMQSIENNKELRADLVAKGIEQAKKFSWEKTADLLWDSILKTV